MDSPNEPISTTQIEEITAFEFMCTPIIRGSTPIRSCAVTIYARTKEEAEHIFYSEAHKFFELDLNMVVNRTMKGYRQT